jgi:hypothetical protein
MKSLIYVINLHYDNEVFTIKITTLIYIYYLENKNNKA